MLLLARLLNPILAALLNLQKVQCTSGESNSGLVRGKDLCCGNKARFNMGRPAAGSGCGSSSGGSSAMGQQA